MTLDVNTAIGCSWAALSLVWLAGVLFTKRTVRSQPTGTRLFHLALIALGFSLLGAKWFSVGWLGERFLADSAQVAWVGLVLTIAGCLFAVWARLTLGSNWSARATVKAGHELITRGPYALSRHPIYTGLMIAVIGTALARGEWRCVLAFVVILVGLLVKMGQEERLMLQTFPETYAAYRQRVKALIPGLF
jgi:protein-S-isoprenylcysteine O-methyltransferase